MPMKNLRRPRRTIPGAFVLFAMAAAAPLVGQQGGLPTLAVLDLRDGGSMGPDVQDLSNLGAGLAMMLTTEMMRNPRTSMVERDQIKQLVAEQSLTLSGMIDPSTAIEVGKLLGAQYMLFGTYTDIMSRLRIDVRVVEVQTGKLMQAREVTRARDEVFETVAELAGMIFEDLDLEPTEEVARPKPTPAAAVIFFSKGIGYEDRGDADKAKEMFESALRIFPDYREAKDRLAKLGAGR
jgi:TolB-like protein